MFFSADSVEIISLFQRLGPAAPMALRVKIESFDLADRAFVFVESVGQRVELQSVKLVDSTSGAQVDEPINQTLSRDLEREARKAHC